MRKLAIVLFTAAALRAAPNLKSTPTPGELTRAEVVYLWMNPELSVSPELRGQLEELGVAMVAFDVYRVTVEVRAVASDVDWRKVRTLLGVQAVSLVQRGRVIDP